MTRRMRAATKRQLSGRPLRGLVSRGNEPTPTQATIVQGVTCDVCQEPAEVFRCDKCYSEEVEGG